jgi:hypothetical protein
MVFFIYIMTFLKIWAVKIPYFKIGRLKFKSIKTVGLTFQILK